MRAVLFADVVATSAAVGATRSRKAKVEALAELLRGLSEAEVEPAVAWLAGAPRQGRIGTGWRTLAELRREPASTATLEVGEVDAVLAELAGTSGSGSAARRRDLITGLLAAATADEQDFLFRLMTGEVRHGALEGVMVEAVARAGDVGADVVRRAFMLSGRLPVTAAAALTGGEAALEEFRLEVGRPVRPMLAAPAENLDDALAELGGEVSVEYKLDGARIQVHRAGDAVWVFTRTLRDITTGVPELVDLARSLPCEQVVLDGETLALTDTGRPRPFQETMSRFGTEDPRALLLRPYFFDCLHVDGRDLLDVSLDQRQHELERIVGEHRIPTVVRPDVEVAAAHLDASLDGGHEGVVVKSLATPYAAGRRGRGWLKVKPVHTLDLVVLGAEWGYGRRTGWLSNLHLGARDPDGGEPIMVGKTFKGLTDALLTWQTEEFPKHERARDAHAVYLHPELVVEIELDGVQTSPRYDGGVALRFARVLRYRPDKDPAEADTITAVRALLPAD
ncbi:MAG TPA: ATP-dependent DNA ligase [Jiangellaceae bacterium]|nr:ATP-dependent DNA ligase [Jiangellaceae bacterium]